MSNPVGGDLLPQMGIASVAPNTYGIYVENHDPQVFPTIANYRLDFVVQAVPEPASRWLLLGGLGWLGVRAWRKTRRNNVVLLLFVFSAATAFGQGRILWDEETNGPFSQYASDPTILPRPQFGTNSVISGVQFQPVNGGPGGVLFSDFFRLTVDSTEAITGVFLAYGSPIDLWIGSSTYDAELASSTSLSMGSVLPQLGIGRLGQGDYAFYISARGYGGSPFTANYRLDFVVQAIPEPASLWLLLGGVGWLGFRWRREGKPVLHR